MRNMEPIPSVASVREKMSQKGHEWRQRRASEGRYKMYKYTRYVTRMRWLIFYSGEAPFLKTNGWRRSSTFTGGIRLGKSERYHLFFRICVGQRMMEWDFLSDRSFSLVRVRDSASFFQQVSKNQENISSARSFQTKLARRVRDPKRSCTSSVRQNLSRGLRA